jgi:serine protease Do
MNFVVPISVVKEFLDRVNVKPSESLVTKTYKEAIDLYYKEYYKKALIKFQEVADLCPGHAYVQKYVADSTMAISEGKDKSVSGWVLFVIPVVFIVIGVVVMMRKKGAIPAATVNGLADGEGE